MFRLRGSFTERPYRTPLSCLWTLNFEVFEHLARHLRHFWLFVKHFDHLARNFESSRTEFWPYRITIHFFFLNLNSYIRSSLWMQCFLTLALWILRSDSRVANFLNIFFCKYFHCCLWIHKFTTTYTIIIYVWFQRVWKFFLGWAGIKSLDNFLEILVI